MKILCTICARGGSKEIKNKNIIKINNKELIYYTIDVAKKSKLFYDIVVSSDNKKILKIAEKYGIKEKLLRDKNLSSDSAGKIYAIKDCLIEMENRRNIKYDIICDLDVTSPLRKTSDVINAYKIFKNRSYPNLVSVNISRRNPYFNIVEKRNNKLKVCIDNKNFLSRQKAPKVFDVNASIYFWKRQSLLDTSRVINEKTGTYIMPFERSIDIDSHEDLKLVKLLLKK